MATLNGEIIRELITRTHVPIVFRGFVSDWPLTQWNIENWSALFADKEIPFRCLNKDLRSDEPCWERRCKVKNTTFQNFIDVSATSEQWMYFDYKHLHMWFNSDSDLFKEVTWKKFGFPDKGAADTTIWIGNKGAHTPAHQDTYGFNIVTQLCGKKRWILFPPETGGLKPTRVPYEESSIYSELNFYRPINLDVFNGVTGGRMVELSAGDALVIPRSWWHYVQNLDPLNIALNIWLPHEKDSSARVSEALVKIFVAQVCKDLPAETARLMLNYGEEDIVDMPLTVLFLQLETVTDEYLASKRRTRRVKRQKTREDDDSAVATDGTNATDCDMNSIIENKANNLVVPPVISSAELIELIKGNLQEFGEEGEEEETEGCVTGLRLTKAVIDAFSQSNVIDAVKQNLLAKLG